MTKIFQSKFVRVLKEHSDLNFNGYGRWQSNRVPDNVVAEQMQASRVKLVASAHAVEQISKWLLKNIVKTKRINANASSYRLKHLVEQEILGYVSDGQLIAAAIVAGYGFSVWDCEALFAMSIRSIKAVHNRINATTDSRSRFFIEVPADVTFH